MKNNKFLTLMIALSIINTASCKDIKTKENVINNIKQTNKSTIASYNTPITGIWIYQEKNDYLQSFTLEIQKASDKYIGYHCIVSDNGNKTDCIFGDDGMPPTLTQLSEDNNKLRMEFKSMFSNEKGIVVLTIIDESTINWSIEKSIVGENYFPQNGTLKKVP